MKNILTIAILVLAIASISLAQDDTKKPNFSGTWKLSAEKSDLGGMPAPTSLVMTIKHQGMNVEVSATANGKTVPAKTYEIGGKEIPVESDCCGVGKTKYWWEGQALLSEFKWEHGTQKDSRSLSTDGKVMTVTRTINQSQEKERILKFAFEKQ